MSKNYENEINKNICKNKNIENPKPSVETSLKSLTNEISGRQQSSIREKLTRYGHYDKLQG